MEAYPLHWPVGWPRTQKPQRSRFDGTPGRIKTELLEEIRKLGGRNPIISTNIALRRDGLPYANQRPVDDPGVAVYFELNGEQMVLACDAWDQVHHNMRAISKTIEAMRGMERWGVSELLNRAFMGFKALPSKATLVWPEVLRVPESASMAEIEAAYKRRLKEAHPDHGGTLEEFQAVRDAYQRAKEGVR